MVLGLTRFLLWSRNEIQLNWSNFSAIKERFRWCRDRCAKRKFLSLLAERTNQLKVLLTISSLLFCTLLVIESPARAIGEETEGYVSITAQELQALMGKGEDLLVIDTLPKSKYNREHLPGAVNFEFPNGEMETWDNSRTAGKSQVDFFSLLGEDKERPLAFYCLDDT